MADVNGALAAHLEGEITTLCHCWRLTRKDGTVFGFTDHDRSVTCDGTQFQPETGFSASETKSSFDLSVDTVDVEGALSASVISEEDIVKGLYDGARVETFIVNWTDQTGFARLRSAMIGKVTRRDGVFIAELESPHWALDRPNGKTIRRLCDAELGDARCGFALSASQFTGSGTVLAVEAGDIVRVSGLSGFSQNWFANGRLTWTSGSEAGRVFRVLSHRLRAGQVHLALWREGPSAVKAGDGFTIVAGCDKSFSTCKAKFANGVNFRGFPHLPGDDTAYDYVADGGVFDGGALVP